MKVKSKAVKDKEWKKAVRERDVHCQICGPQSRPTQKILNCHHLIPREFEEFRWDVDNGMLLCVHHHAWGKLSAHKNPIWFSEWLLRNKKPIWDWVVNRLF